MLPPNSSLGEKQTKNFNLNNNGISIGNADEDGFYIQETNTDNKVYIYFTETDDLIQQIRKLRNCYQGNKASTKKEYPETCDSYINISERKDLVKYRQYLGSDEWKLKRMVVLQRDGYQCRECGSHEHLEVHHMGYGGLSGGDDLDMLRTVCHRCHVNVEGLKRKKRSGVI